MCVCVCVWGGGGGGDNCSVLDMTGFELGIILFILMKTPFQSTW